MVFKDFVIPEYILKRNDLISAKNKEALALSKVTELRHHIGYPQEAYSQLLELKDEMTQKPIFYKDIALEVVSLYCALGTESKLKLQNALDMTLFSTKTKENNPEKVNKQSIDFSIG